MCEDLRDGTPEGSDLIDYIAQIKARAGELQRYLLLGERELHFDKFETEMRHLEVDARYLCQCLRIERDPQKRMDLEAALSLVNTFYHLWDSVVFYRSRLIDGVLANQ